MAARGTVGTGRPESRDQIWRRGIHRDQPNPLRQARDSDGPTAGPRAEKAKSGVQKSRSGTYTGWMVITSSLIRDIWIRKLGGGPNRRSRHQSDWKTRLSVNLRGSKMCAAASMQTAREKRVRSVPDSQDLKLYTVEQVATLCQVSVKTVYRAIWHGRLRAAQLGVGAAYRIRAQDLDEWVETSVRRTAPPGSSVRTFKTKTGRRRSKRSPRANPEGRLFLPDEMDQSA